MYGIDPKGSVKYNGVTVPTILCHADSHKLGLGSNHGDVLHWFLKFGKNMDTVRADVAALMGEATVSEPVSGNVDDPERTIWDYLMKKIGNAYGVAVLIGNLYTESGLRANNLQNSYEKKLNITDAVLLWYERPADQSDAVQKKRAGYGQGYYEKYAGDNVPSSGGMSNVDCPFLVRVTAEDLRIRKGNGTDTAWTEKYAPPGVYTIVELKAGKGSRADGEG